MQKSRWVWVPWFCAVIGCGSEVTPVSTGTAITDAAGMGGASAAAGSGSSLPRGSGGRASTAGNAGNAGRTSEASGGRTSTNNGGKGGAVAAGAGGNAGRGGNDTPGEPLSCPSSAPAEFKANASVGGGRGRFKDSPHFRVYGDASDTVVSTALNHAEAAYSCFVEDLCFRSTGLSVHEDDGPYSKLNIYGVPALEGAAGVMQYDDGAGLSYLEVVNDQLPIPRVTVHEFGHSLALTEHNWVDQIRTGAWWETVANWVADTYLTAPVCEAARKRFGVPAGSTIIDLDKVIGQSHLLIVSTQNYYEAWPFLTYLTNNPDQYPGLGRTAIRDLMRNHPRNNETPLHVLERVAAPVRAQTILGRYWARMAYLDIGHAQAQKAFFDRRRNLDFASLEPAGEQTYRVRSARRPMYGGANIIPLSGTGSVSVEVTKRDNGLAESNFTATLSIRAGDGAVRYVDLPDGAGEATVASGEEATLVVVNTPDRLYQYDAFQSKSGSPEATGLDYQVRITGAVPSDN